MSALGEGDSDWLSGQEGEEGCIEVVSWPTMKDALFLHASQHVKVNKSRCYYC